MGPEEYCSRAGDALHLLSLGLGGVVSHQRNSRGSNREPAQ